MIRYNKILIIRGGTNLDIDIDIGNKIKELRKEKNMNISDLAKQAELSNGLISQIERNIVTPSIVSLWKIATALEVSVGSFFEEEKHNPNPIVRYNNRKRIMTSNKKAIYELLSPDLNRKIEFLYITINVGDYSHDDFVVHEGEEAGIVLKGRLKIETPARDYILEEGDSIYLDSSIPHRFVNVGEKTCQSIWAMTPPSF